MINILKSDFYKLIKSKILMICIIVVACIGVLQIVLLEVLFSMLMSVADGRYAMHFQQIKTAMNLTGSGCLLQTGANDSFTPLIVVAVALVAMYEFSSGSIKNIVARGVNRNYIVISKWILSIFSAVAVYLVYQVVISITATIVTGFGDAGDNFILNFLLVEIINIILVGVIASFTALICFLTRKTSLSVAIPLAISMLLPSVIEVLNSIVQMAIHWLDVRYVWLPTFMLTTDKIIHTNTAFAVAGVGLLEIILFMMLAMLKFNKSEIK